MYLINSSDTFDISNAIKDDVLFYDCYDKIIDIINLLEYYKNLDGSVDSKNIFTVSFYTSFEISNNNEGNYINIFIEQLHDLNVEVYNYKDILPRIEKSYIRRRYDEKLVCDVVFIIEECTNDIITFCTNISNIGYVTHLYTDSEEFEEYENYKGRFNIEDSGKILNNANLCVIVDSNGHMITGCSFCCGTPVISNIKYTDDVMIMENKPCKQIINNINNKFKVSTYLNKKYPHIVGENWLKKFVSNKNI